MKFRRTQNHPVSAPHTWRLASAATAGSGDRTEQCPLCGRHAVWQWQKVSNEGEVSRRIPICDTHRSELQVSTDGLVHLRGTSGAGVSPRILTPDDVRQFLGYLHYIPAGRGWKSNTQVRFSEWSDGHLLGILRELKVVKHGEHFSGWVVRDQVEWVVFRRPDDWTAVFVSN